MKYYINHNDDEPIATFTDIPFCKNNEVEYYLKVKLTMKSKMICITLSRKLKRHALLLSEGGGR